MAELNPGDVVGNYVLDQTLDEGGQGYIWRAHEVGSTGNFVALKILTKPQSTGEVGSLRREIEILAATAANRSEHIVKVLGGAAEPVPYIVMEYIDGSDLRKELLRLSSVYGPEAGHFSQVDAVNVGIAVADALTTLHEEGIIHRDVKPANVMMDRRGNIKLTDFGIAKIAGTSPVTALNQQPLSLFYAAPEVWDGESVFASDVYALGVSLYELLTGSCPFQGSPTTLFQKHVSEAPDLGKLPAGTDAGLAELVNVCMAKAAADRPTARVCRDILTTIKNELTQRDVQSKTSQLREPDHFGAWQLISRDPERAWTWLGRHGTSGAEGVVELYFARDLAELETLIGQARRIVEINPRLVPLGAERLLAVNRFLLGPSEAWSQEPPGRFFYFVVRDVEPRITPPDFVSKALLLTTAQSLLALVKQARAEGVELDLSPSELTLKPDGTVYLRHPGLRDAGGVDMDRAAMEFMRVLPLNAEARAVIDGAPSVEALISVLTQAPRAQTPAYVWEEIQQDAGAAKDSDATQIVDRVTTSSAAPSAEEAVTRLVEPPPRPMPIEAPLVAPPRLPPVVVVLRSVKGGTRSGPARFELGLINNTSQDQTFRITNEGSEGDVSFPASAEVAAGQELAVAIQARPSKGRKWGPAIERRLALRVTWASGSEVVQGTFRDEAKPWMALAGVAAVVAVCAVVAAVVFSSGGGGGGGSPSKATTPATNAARADLDNFEFGKAVTDFTAAIKEDPNNSSLYSGRGAAYLSQADLPKAKADADKAIELDAKNAEAYHIRSLVLGTLWNYDGALADANKAVELDPKNPIYFAARSLTFADREPDRALQDANKAVELGPNVAEAHIALGSVYRDQKRFADAETEINKAISLQPKGGTNYIGRAYLFWVKGDGDQAIKRLADDRAVIESYPLSQAQGDVTRGVFNFGMGKYNDALAEFDKSNGIIPNWPTYYFWHGFTQYTQKNFTGAMADYNRALEIAPSWPSLLYLRSLALRDQNKLNDALADLTKAVSLDAKNATYRSERGNVNSLLKNFPEALTDLNQAIALNPDDADTLGRRGNVNNALNNSQAAVDDFTKAIQKRDNDLNFYLGRGAANQRLNRLTEAQNDYTKARSLAKTPDEIQQTQTALDSLKR